MEMTEVGTSQTDTTETTSENVSEWKSNCNKSRITNFTLASINTRGDVAIDQLHDNHYFYRRGSTKVHVQTYDASAASDVIDEDDDDNLYLDSLKLLSGIIWMIFVVITTVIKLTAAINSKIEESEQKAYMLSLYSAGFIWTSYYNCKGICVKQKEMKFSKSNKSSNRWLKGVIMLFGVIIVLNYLLEFIANLMIANLQECKTQQISTATAFVYGLFIISQVFYILKFSKVYIRKDSFGSSTGLMFLVAVNLSTWISADVDETVKALSETTNYTSYAAEANSSCSCVSSFCSAVHTAETFLHPFSIEFSLVASSFLYVIWGNIGKQPPPCEKVVKPNYKFYKKYIGIVLGVIAMFATAVFLLLLGTSSSSTKESAKNYYSEKRQLLLYDSFLIAIESVMLISTLIGFFFFYRILRPLEKTPMLDEMLLGICVLGPVVLNSFSLVAAIDEPDLESDNWELTLVHPLVDVLQCTLQVIFIIYGLKREPIISAIAKETATDLTQRISSTEEPVSSPSKNSESNEQINNYSDKVTGNSKVSFDNKAYLKSHRSSITTVVTKLAQPQINEVLEDEESTGGGIKVVCEEEINDIKEDVESRTLSKESFVDIDNSPSSIIKVVLETKVFRPDQDRIRLRDTIMFLLITNACLWVFLSLGGTAYTVYQYEHIYFGTSAWTIITMMCRPLNIFFRMHSAGCLFEMWSYA